MTDIDTTNYKNQLEEELKTLETELSRVGRINPTNPADWEAVPEKENVEDDADLNVVADHKEAYEENSAVLKELETRYNNVKLALQKIADGTYGICEVSGEPIETARLDANPAARTSTKHLNDLEEKI